MSEGGGEREGKGVSEGGGERKEERELDTNWTNGVSFGRHSPPPPPFQNLTPLGTRQLIGMQSYSLIGPRSCDQVLQY